MHIRWRNVLDGVCWPLNEGEYLGVKLPVKTWNCFRLTKTDDYDSWGDGIDQWFCLMLNYFGSSSSSFYCYYYYYGTMWSRWCEWIIAKDSASSHHDFPSQSVHQWRRSTGRCRAASLCWSSVYPQHHWPRQFAQLFFTLSTDSLSPQLKNRFFWLKKPILVSLLGFGAFGLNLVFFWGFCRFSVIRTSTAR